MKLMTMPQHLVLSLLLLLTGCEPTAAEEAVSIAVIKNEIINESSGLAASYSNTSALWIHNDSGDKARLYLVGLNGELRAKLDVRGADSVDWEDMCSFSLNGQAWLLIGDIGDNLRRRGKKGPKCRLYLIKEPKIPRANGLPTVRAEVAVEIKFEYDDGRWDCEGVAVDVDRKEILLVTKGAPHKCGLYVLPLDMSSRKQSLKAKRIGSPFVPFATALDISPTGRTMVVGTMLGGLTVSRTASQSWEDAFKLPGQGLELPARVQGETICFDQSGKWLYLNSEGREQPLWRIPAPQQ